MINVGTKFKFVTSSIIYHIRYISPCDGNMDVYYIEQGVEKYWSLNLKDFKTLYVKGKLVEFVKREFTPKYKVKKFSFV